MRALVEKGERERGIDRYSGWYPRRPGLFYRTLGHDGGGFG